MSIDSPSIFVSSIEGNRQSLDGGAMFGNLPRALWEKWQIPDARGRIQLACRGMLVEVETDLSKKRLLCEVGIGCYMDPKLSERFGVLGREHELLLSLEKIGLHPEDIDVLVLSHLHFDHAGGLLKPHEKLRDPGGPLCREDLVFPCAKYVIGEEAFQRALNPHPRDRASFIPGLAELLQKDCDLNLVSRLETSSQVSGPEISFLFSDGHTPGQMHSVVRGERDTICFAGDLVPGRLWIHLPITMGYDRFAEKVIDEKAELYLEGKDWIYFFTHDAEVAASRLDCDQSGKYFAGETWDRLTRKLL